MIRLILITTVFILCLAYRPDAAAAASVTATPASVAPGGTVTVTVTNSDGGQHDWVGLFAVGASNFSNPILWEYLSGTQHLPPSGLTSATLTFVLPSNLAPGQYVFNLEFDNGVNSYTLGASSNTVTVTSTTVINGSCGSANGVPTSTAPTTNLCSAGTASAVSGSGPWSWSCAGSNGGTTAQCSAPLAQSGSATVSATPASVAPGGTVTVTVTNSDGGRHDWVGLFPVGASNFSNPILWEYLSGTQNLPPSGLTSATLTFVLPSNLAPGQYVFNLEFDNGVSSYTLGASSNTVTVTSTTVINGSCGSANGVPTSTAPTTNLCSAGTASAVSGSGPWSWSCAGSNGGTTAQCSAPLAQSGSATVSATPASVAPGGTVTVTVTNSDGGRHDWVGLFAVGASNFSNPILWEYLSGTHNLPPSGLTSATLTFVLPSNLAPGQYVFNLEFDNGVSSYTLGASSNTITVTSGGGGSVVARAITHLYNNQRTGWNSNETTLTTSNVNSSSFGLLNSVTVDEQVDAQPLVITFNGVDQVFVATENDTVYRIAAASGTILQSRNLGTPVPQSSLPGSCNNNSAVVGITSTPVIDVSTQTMYVMTYTVESGSPVYRIHALDLETLADKVGSGVVVSASGRLSDGSTYAFNPAVSRQRSALLEANGNIYAGFSSFCDIANNLSRGWVLGWQAGNLTPLAANELTNKLATSTNSVFLSSVWMSGAGPAADENGNIFFATGNSDYSGTSYDAVLNLSESVIAMSADLSTVVGAFTPTQSPDDQPTLDVNDDDFGSGGVLLVPNQSSLPIPYLALAVGKAGYYYLLDRSTTFAGPTSLSKISQRLNGNGIFGNNGDGCWCATTYFTGSDGVPRIVAGLQNFLATFKLQASGSSVVMNSETQNTLSTGQDGGFFTSISSNGTTAGSAVIWAVTRPTSVNINLVAFDDPHNRIIYTSSSSHAGTWPNTGGNANLVPVVANGRVFVGGYKNLAIFGLGGSP